MGVQDDTCHSCGEIAHHAHQCPSKIQHQQQQQQSAGKGGKGSKGSKGREYLKGLKCDFCGIKNSHTEDKCRKKEAVMANIQSVNTSAFNVSEPTGPRPQYDP